MKARFTYSDLTFLLLCCALNLFHNIQCRTLLINTTPTSLLKHTTTVSHGYLRPTPFPRILDFLDEFGNIRLQNVSTTPTERNSGNLLPPKIVKIDITSNIQYRYAKTVVKAYIKNPSVSTPQEVKFNMMLPNTAFISNFTIQIKGEDQIYVAKVAKKEDAQRSYNEAISRGQSAGIVDADTRNVNQITVRSNLKAASKMEFTLTYEELLKRHISKYEHIIHVHPGQIVEDYKVNVYINESLPITNINVPELKTGENEITSQLEKNKVAIVQQNISGDPRKAHIQFMPTTEDQKRMVVFGDDVFKGMSGQFIVQYDVDRKNEGSDVQVLDGYFVHFFAPDYLQPLPKHVVFVLDVSGSMMGTKLVQLKDAMLTILDDLSDQDYFNILIFSNRVQQWTPNRLRGRHVSRANKIKREFFQSFSQDPTQYPYYATTTMRYGNEIEDSKPPALTNQGTHSLRREARKWVLNQNAGGGTNINDALLEALNVGKKVRMSETIPSNANPMIIFLTDGEATSGVSNQEQIRKNVREENRNLNIPIYGLAFGTGADFDLIKAIGAESGAFSRRIYEASDAAIQLEDFYAEISSPLLTNVTFDYVGEAFKNKTNKKFSTFFKGSEYIIAGKMEQLDHQNEEEELEIVILAQGNSSRYRESIRPCKPIPLPKPLPDIETLPDYENEHVVAENNSVSLNKFEPSTIIYIPTRPCIPWPNPPHIPHPNIDPPNEKSEEENFIERLWAYLTIENLLDEKSSSVEIEKMHGNNVSEVEMVNRTKSNEEKALSLALQYNFVTKLTSLVVVQPDGNNTNEASNGTIVNPVPVEAISHRPSVYRSSYHSKKMSSSWSGMRSGGPRGRGGSRGGGGARSGGGGRYRSYSLNAYPRNQFMSGGGYASSSNSYCPTCSVSLSMSAPMVRSGFSYNMARMGPPTTTATTLRAKSSYESNLLFEDSWQVPSSATIGYNRRNPPWLPTATETTITATTTTSVLTDCSIKLFEKTYLRGSSLTIRNTDNSTVSDLSAYSFDDKLSSLEVIGPCCWEVFESIGFMGHRKRFTAGKYKSSTMLGADLAKEASSLRITTC